MIEIVEARPDDWAQVRAVRLAALQDTPDWFWATYEDEAGRPESWWRDFVSAGTCFLARDGRRAVGIAAGIAIPELPEGSRMLISMWVAPEARGMGTGRRLAQAVIDTARADGIEQLYLEVTSGNEAARRLYESLGFEPTGEVEPHPRDPRLAEHQMVLRF